MSRARAHGWRGITVAATSSEPACATAMVMAEVGEQLALPTLHDSTDGRG